MKLFLKISALVFLFPIVSNSMASTAVYSSLSNEEMTQMRAQESQMSAADRSNYQNEMRIRMKLMNSDELAEFRQNSGITAQTPGYIINSTSEIPRTQPDKSRGKGKGDGKGKGSGSRSGQGRGGRGG